MPTPEISIVMPVYNRQDYVQISIESILNQTYKNFEFIIIDDGSTDNTLEIVKSYTDKRIKILKNEKNCGIVESRNRGISQAKGKFISMFDSDDIALQNKLEIQLNFLYQNPDIAMVGAWARWIDENGNLLRKKWKLNAKPDEIPAIMLFRNYFVQSTILIRKEAIPDGAYTLGFDIVEDYKMWFDVALKHKVANVGKYLVLYRIHQGNISDLNEKHYNNEKQLFRYIFKHLSIEISDNEIEYHYLIKNDIKIDSREKLIKIEQWLLKILKKNKELNVFDHKRLKRTILNRWLKVCYKSKSVFFSTIKRLIFSPLTYISIKKS